MARASTSSAPASRKSEQRQQRGGQRAEGRGEVGVHDAGRDHLVADLHRRRRRVLWALCERAAARSAWRGGTLAVSRSRRRPAGAAAALRRARPPPSCALWIRSGQSEYSSTQRFQFFQRLAVRLLAVAARAIVPSAAFEDLRALRRRRARRPRPAPCQQDGRAAQRRREHARLAEPLDGDPGIGEQGHATNAPPGERRRLASARENPRAQASWRVGAHVALRRPRRARRAAARRPPAPASPGQRARVAGGHHQPVAPVAHQSAGDGAHGVACDHGKRSVHRLVDHQPPGLAEGAGGDRRHHQNVGGGVEVAQSHGGHGVQTDDALLRERHRAAGGDPRGAGSHADEDERGGGARRPDARQASMSTLSLFPGRATDKQKLHGRLRIGHPGPVSASAAGCTGRGVGVASWPGALPERQLSTACGAMCTLRAPRART